MKKLVTLFFISISFCSCSQEDFKTLDDEAYTIQYPETWEVNQSGQMGMSFGLFSPIKFEGDMFRENVNLVIQDLAASPMDLTEYVNVSTKQIRTMILDSEILKSKTIGNYQQMIYTGTMGQFKLKFLQNYWIDNGKAYILTFTAEQSEYDNYEKVATQIMDTFKIK